MYIFSFVISQLVEQRKLKSNDFSVLHTMLVSVSLNERGLSKRRLCQFLKKCMALFTTIMTIISLFFINLKGGGKEGCGMDLELLFQLAFHISSHFKINTNKVVFIGS